MGSRLFIYLIVFFSAYTVQTSASVIIEGTRVIMHEEDGETTLQLANKGNYVGFVQLWIDQNDADTTPENIKVPFLLTPPLARIEPGKGQAIRIIKLNTEIPSDRESFYWFNMLEIPYKINEANHRKNLMQLAFRTRIKLFIRPPNLSESPSTAYKNVTFSLSKGELTIINDSQYYITFRSVSIYSLDGLSTLANIVDFTPRMVSPKSHTKYAVKYFSKNHHQNATIKYSVINDYGGENKYEKSL